MITVSLGVSILILAAFFQIRAWDKHALEVIPLQIRSQFGALDMTDMDHMAAICMDRSDYDCVEQEYMTIAISTNDPNQMLRLAKFQMSRARYPQAADSFRRYIDKGGGDLTARYNLARALGQIGNIDEASKYYEEVLKAKPEILQITVIQNYVKLLISAHRIDRAKQLVKNVREKSDSSPDFMEKEMAMIESASSGREPATR